jgi:hypothetical protein
MNLGFRRLVLGIGQVFLLEFDGGSDFLDSTSSFCKPGETRSSKQDVKVGHGDGNGKGKFAMNSSGTVDGWSSTTATPLVSKTGRDRTLYFWSIDREILAGR